MRKPLEVYFWRTICKCLRICFLDRLVGNDTERYINLLEIAWKTGMPWTKKKSRHKVPFWHSVRICRGIDISMVSGMCSGWTRVVLPFRDGTDGPYIETARFASATVRGLFQMKELLIIDSKFPCAGLRRTRLKSRALSALCTSRFL